MDAIIQALNYSFGLGGKRILKDITFTVERGEYVSIIGPNGAGKTTLLKCLNGIYRGGIGDIGIKGKALRGYSPKESARLISYVPQADGRSSPFTVKEFVMMGRYPYSSPFSSPGRQDREAVAYALELTGTTAFAAHHLETLSGGERQKVFIAAALAQGAEIILLDEPTAFLDPKHQEQICRVLRRINRESGSTIITATHDINQAMLLSGRILALKEGVVLFWGLAEEIIRPGILQNLYEKTFQILVNPVTGRPFVVPELIL